MDEDGDGSAGLAIGKGTPANIVKTRNSGGEALLSLKSSAIHLHSTAKILDTKHLINYSAKTADFFCNSKLEEKKFHSWGITFNLDRTINKKAHSGFINVYSEVLHTIGKNQLSGSWTEYISNFYQSLNFSII